MPKDQKKKTGRQNYDWISIQHEYVTDPNMTLRKIAAKHGISYKTVAHRSKADNWFASRKKHQSKVLSKGLSKTADLQAKELSDEADFLKLMKGHMNKMLSDSEQFQRHLVTNIVTGDTEEKIYGKADSRAMKDAMQTLDLIEKMTRSLYNLQKAEAIQKSQLDAERLALEREKFEFEKQKAEMFKPTEGNAIRIEGFDKEWSK